MSRWRSFTASVSTDLASFRHGGDTHFFTMTTQVRQTALTALRSTNTHYGRRYLHASVSRLGIPCAGLMEPDLRTDPATEILESFGGPANVEHFRRISRDFRSDSWP